MLNARALVNEAWNIGMRPPVDMTVSQWADQHREMSSSVTSAPGRWRTDRVPYTRQIMDCLSPLHPAREVWFMKGSQIGGTECSLNWLGFIVDQEPASVMIVLPDQGTAKEWSTQRLAELATGTPRLAGKIRDPRQRDGGNTIFSKKIPGGHIKITWSSSAKKLRSTPASNIIADEVDGFEGDVKGEGDPIALLRRRFTNSPRGKLFGISTPTLRHMSRIDREFTNGDQRYYFVPCPHCGHFQRITFDKLVWHEGQPESAHLLCIGCEKGIAESYKTQMLSRGMWVATAAAPDLVTNGFSGAELPDMADIFQAMEEASIVSFHLSAFYSPIGWYSWPQAAVDWEAANQGGPTMLKPFVNTVKGETWTEKVEALDYEKLYGRKEEFDLGIIPAGGLFVTGFCDVQADRLEVSFCAWGRNQERWGIWYEVIQGDPGTNVPWKRLEELLKQNWKHASGAILPVMVMGIDTGYRPQKVYEFCVKQRQPLYDVSRGIWVTAPRTCVPTKGGHSWSKIVEMVSGTDAAKKRGGLRIVTLGVSAIKKEFNHQLGSQRPEPGEAYPTGYCHYAYKDIAFYQGLCSESFVVRGGKPQWVRDPRFRNEPLDLEVGNRGVAQLYLDLTRANESKLAALEADIRAQVEALKAGRPAPGVLVSQRSTVVSKFMSGR
jgi:phage terminase large subunit GpA-like protein